MTNKSRIQTADLLIIGQPAQPPEPPLLIFQFNNKAPPQAEDVCELFR